MGDGGATDRGRRRAGARGRLAVTAAALIALPPLAGLIAALPLDGRPPAPQEIAVPGPEVAAPVPGSSPEAGTGTADATATTVPAEDPPTLAQTAPDPSISVSGSGLGKAGGKGDAPTPGTVEQRGAAALALIDYPWAATGYSIVFAGPNQGLMGLTEGSRKQITIYVRPGQSARSIAWVLGHEIGHAVDFTMTTDAERAEYRRIRGLGDRPWYPCEVCSDYASPAGDWAETFAAWLLGDGPFASQLGPRPTAAQLNALTPIFAADAAVVATPATRPPPVTTTTRVAPAAPAPKSTTTVPRSVTWRPRSATPTTTRSTPTTNPRQWTPPTRPPTTTTTRPPSPPATAPPPTTTSTRPPPTTTSTRPPSTTTSTRPASTTTTTRPPSTTTTRPPTTTTTEPSTTSKPATTTTTSDSPA